MMVTEPHRRSIRFGEEEKLLPMPENETHALGYPATSLACIVTYLKASAINMTT
jgi:hypothetical protein